MCDTICVLKDHSENGAVMLAKNSDREPNEPHVITFVPAVEHAKGSVKCTYIEIPQAARTNAVLLFKPDWIWGAEMGVNEYGVGIGNEAVFTKAKKGPDALTGMDLLRLALERADTAQTAMDVIIRLLGEFGQGGNCGYSKDFRYDNSFLITDKSSAYILETSGRNYAAVPVSGKAAISNRLFIHGGHTLSEGLAENGDFAKRFTEPVFSFFARGKQRRAQSLCAVNSSPVTVKQMIAALRAKRDELESKWLDEEEELFTGTPRADQLIDFAGRAAAEEQAMVDEFSVEGWDNIGGSSRFAKYWREKNVALGR